MFLVVFFPQFPRVKEGSQERACMEGKRIWLPKAAEIRPKINWCKKALNCETGPLVLFKGSEKQAGKKKTEG